MSVSANSALDAGVQRAMEGRMGDSFGDVEVHTGARAASACDDINAKAFTVGNNIAFNSGEYDPSSAEGQHVIAHELAHVRQQTGGAVSMLPKDDVDLEIDPDPELEREAEETAQRVMQGGELGIQRMKDIEVHVQRMAEWGEHPLTNRDDDTEADTGVSYRDVLTTIAGSSLSATASHVIATNIAKEIGLVNPQAAVLTATAGIGITTAGAIAGKVELYKQIDPQILRRAFEAAGKEQLLADILNTLGHDTEWAESGDETEEVNY